MNEHGTAGFVAEARQLNQPRVARILAHPFNRELAAGTLDRRRFTFYIAQDAQYLDAFTRALTIAAGRAPSPLAHRALLELAGEGLDGERELHSMLRVDTSIPAGPACAAYSDFLLATAACGAYAEALAALTPCYSVYSEVAATIAAASAPDNQYARWIATYDAAAFNVSTSKITALTDEAAAAASPALRAAMHHAFSRSIIHEWCFWDDAYHHRAWPI